MIFDCRCKHGIKKSFVAEVMYQLFFEIEFKDTKVVIRIRLSKKNSQHNGQKKKNSQHNGQKKKNSQHNGQKKKNSQHNGQKKKNSQHNGQKKKAQKDKQQYTKHTYKTNDRGT